MKTKEITNSEDIIDSRDVIKRIEELTDELTDAYEGQSKNTGKFDEWLAEMADNDEGTLQDAAKELIALKALADEAEGYADDWKHGAMLIRRTYFVEYCEDMVKDIGDLPKEIPHYIAIDWDKTADNLEADYTTVDFGGVEYLVR